MPYTDALKNDSSQDVWHVYRDEDVADTDPSTHHVAKSACGGRMVGTGYLLGTKRHGEEEFFDSLKPPSLADWLAHPNGARCAPRRWAGSWGSTVRCGSHDEVTTKHDLR